MKLGSCEPVTVRFQNLKYVVETLASTEDAAVTAAPSKAAPAPAPKGKGAKALKTVLNDISGEIRPGRALAIMGPSGSGKTSLINVLSRRIKTDLQGNPFNVTLNGQQLTEELAVRFGAFVNQEDILFGTSTPRESLHFNARLRLPKTVTEEERTRRVDALLGELGLMKVADSLVGFAGQDAVNSGLKRSLSGGERKRLSIALELITNPSLIYLDEPTTGLDSFSSLSVVNSLARLAATGRSVVYTIHQPSDEIFEQFDLLLLLGLGDVIYFGPAAQALTYFKRMRYVCPSWENPADYLLKVVHVDDRGTDLKAAHERLLRGEEDEEKPVFAVAEKQVRDLAESFRRSDQARENAARLAEPLAAADTSTYANTYYRTGFLSQCGLIITRQLKNLVREPMQLAGTVFQAVFFSVLMGIIFLRLGHSQRNVRDRLGVIFFATIFQMFGALLGPLYLFPSERNVFMREYRNGMYSVSAYYISRVIAELPKTALSPLVFGSIFYWMVGLNPGADNFFVFLGILFVQACCGFAFGILTVALVPDPAVAMSVIPVVFLPIFLFSGFYLRTNAIPKYWIPLEYGLSFVKYSFRAIVENEMKGTVFGCTPDELVTYGGQCPITSGDQVLKQESLDERSIPLDVLILFIFVFVFHTLSFIVLRRSARNGK